MDRSRAWQKHNASTLQVHVWWFKHPVTGLYLCRFLPSAYAMAALQGHFTQKHNPDISAVIYWGRCSFSFLARFVKSKKMLILKSQGLVRYCHAWRETTLNMFQVNVTWKATQSGVYSLIHNLSVFVLFFQLNEGKGLRTCSFLMYNNQQSGISWQALIVWSKFTLWNNSVSFRCTTMKWWHTARLHLTVS